MQRSDYQDTILIFFSMYDICGIGHITLDKVITPNSTKFMPGGTSYYFSNAVRNMQLNYLLVTSLGAGEMHEVDSLRKLGIKINAFESKHSVYFENIYGENVELKGAEENKCD